MKNKTQRRKPWEIKSWGEEIVKRVDIKTTQTSICKVPGIRREGWRVGGGGTRRRGVP